MFSLLFDHQRTVCRVVWDDDRAGTAVFQRVGIRGKIQSAQRAFAMTRSAFGLEEDADGVVPGEDKGLGC